MVNQLIQLDINCTTPNLIIYRKSNRVTILNSIRKRRKQQHNLKQKHKQKSLLLYNQKNKLLSEREILKLIFKH